MLSWSFSCDPQLDFLLLSISFHFLMIKLVLIHIIIYAGQPAVRPAILYITPPKNDAS